jgi:hypothetical protein
MGGQGGQWDRIEVYHWITADRIDLWGGAEMTRAVCTVTDDPAYIQAFDGGVDWNEYPVINGMPDWNDDHAKSVRHLVAPSITAGYGASIRKPPLSRRTDPPC